MYQAETPVGLCKYKDNEKGKFSVCCLSLNPNKVSWNQGCLSCKAVNLFGPKELKLVQ